MHFPYHLLHVPFPPSGQLYPRRWQAAFFLCFAGLVAAFDMSVTSVALPAIADALRASTSDLQFSSTGMPSSSRACSCSEADWPTATAGRACS